MTFRENYLKVISKVKCKESFGMGYNFAKNDFKNQLPEPLELLLIVGNTETVNIYDVDIVINADYKKGYNAALRDVFKVMLSKGYSLRDYESKPLNMAHWLISDLKAKGMSNDEIANELGIRSDELKKLL